MKTCLITGGNAGIGKAAAIQIAGAGHRVIIGCRNQERGERALPEIRKTREVKSSSYSQQPDNIDQVMQLTMNYTKNHSINSKR